MRRLVFFLGSMIGSTLAFVFVVVALVAGVKLANRRRRGPADAIAPFRTSTISAVTRSAPRIACATVRSSLSARARRAVDHIVLVRCMILNGAPRVGPFPSRPFQVLSAAFLPIRALSPGSGSPVSSLPPPSPKWSAPSSPPRSREPNAPARPDAAWRA
jgi:hypothetical protein